MKTNEQIGMEAAETARQEVVRVANEQGVSMVRALQRHNEALDAQDTKFFVIDGKITQRSCIDHKTRLGAVKLGYDIHDAMPSEKHDVTHNAGHGMAEAVAAYRQIKNEQSGD